MNKRLMLIIGLVTAVILFGVFFLIKRGDNKEFKLIQSNPENKQQEVQPDQIITLTFSKPLKENANKNIVELLPYTGGITEINNNKLIFTPHLELEDKKEYTINIFDIESIDGDKLPIIVLSFRVLDNSPRGKFIRSLPYYGRGYNIDYVKSAKTFVIQITSEPIEANKIKAFGYLKNNNITEENEKISVDVLRSLRSDGAPPSDPLGEPEETEGSAN